MHPVGDQHVEPRHDPAQPRRILGLGEIQRRAQRAEPRLQRRGIGAVLGAAVGKDDHAKAVADQPLGQRQIPVVQRLCARRPLCVIADGDLAHHAEPRNGAVAAARLRRVILRRQQPRVAHHLCRVSRGLRHRPVPQRLAVGIAYIDGAQVRAAKRAAEPARARRRPPRRHAAGIDRRGQAALVRLVERERQLRRKIQVEIRNQVAAADHHAVRARQPFGEMRPPLARRSQRQRRAHGDLAQGPRHRLQRLHDCIAPGQHVAVGGACGEVDGAGGRVGAEPDQRMFQAFRQQPIAQIGAELDVETPQDRCLSRHRFRHGSDRKGSAIGHIQAPMPQTWRICGEYVPRRDHCVSQRYPSAQGGLRASPPRIARSGLPPPEGGAADRRPQPRGRDRTGSHG